MNNTSTGVERLPQVGVQQTSVTKERTVPHLSQPGEEPGQLLMERFRVPGDGVAFTISKDLSHDSGYFKFGSGVTCYGQCSVRTSPRSGTAALEDTWQRVVIKSGSVEVPFDPGEILNNLRLERYTAANVVESRLHKMYYRIRPFMAPALRRYCQKLYFSGWDRAGFPRWPVDVTVETIFERLLFLAMKALNIKRLPFIWFWPDGALSCTTMTHDVETAAGLDYCTQLMDIDDSFGIKSAFEIVPEQRYQIRQSLLESIKTKGFELNIHDLNHDGRLFGEAERFGRRAVRINSYARRFGARGFRAAVLYRNTDWFDALDFSYDMSVPNVGHLEVQRGGCCTVFPFFIRSLLELPLTTTQDYSLFHILKDYSLRLWAQQISVILKNNGLISFIIHPDYLREKRARTVYKQLLGYLAGLRSRGETWIALPGEISDWWRVRSKLNLVKAGNSWRIEGAGSERARIAHAVLLDDTVKYELR